MLGIAMLEVVGACGITRTVLLDAHGAVKNEEVSDYIRAAAALLGLALARFVLAHGIEPVVEHYAVRCDERR